MPSQQVAQTIENFKTKGLFSTLPTFSAEEVGAWDKKFGPLPEDYKETLLAGSYDKGTFHFVEPYEYKGNSDWLVFAVWNEDEFAFDRSADWPVVVVTETLEPDVTDEHFGEWFARVYAMVSKPIVSG
jgi:hypothetical protein